MIDRSVISISSGSGGNGCISGRREKFVPLGGPDGGDGGNGGSVFLVADLNVSTLLRFRHRHTFAAQDGSHGMGRLKHGRAGADVTVVVPVGTEVVVDDGNGMRVADMVNPGEQVLIASGGVGGKGNARFTTSTNRFPLLAEEGEGGTTLKLRLELKLLADVGIVGAPNAGKSSLLAAVTAARPKIADYPFTTIEPVLGVVEGRDDSFVMVDIPGLIEGAHEGVGLGHEFLRHISRTRLLVHAVDGSEPDPHGQVLKTNDELRQFDESLMRKPQIVAVNKMDILEVRERKEALAEKMRSQGTPVHFISAVGREGLEQLMRTVWGMLAEEKQRVAEKPAPGANGHVPVIRPLTQRSRKQTDVERVDGVFVVTCVAAERLAPMVDLDDWNAKTQFHRQLNRLGVLKALEAAGAAPGDTIRIGKVEWEWT